MVLAISISLLFTLRRCQYLIPRSDEDRMTDECWTEKDLEGSGCALFKIKSQPNFKPCTFKMQVNVVTYTTNPSWMFLVRRRHTPPPPPIQSHLHLAWTEILYNTASRFTAINCGEKTVALHWVSIACMKTRQIFLASSTYLSPPRIKNWS